MGVRVIARAVVSTLLMGVTLSYAAAAEGSSHANEATYDEEIIVYGRAEAQQGVARSASEGLVGYGDFSTRPLSRVGELVEVVPGMVATQHSGEGKANQYYLRGMNLDHGTDFSTFFEGMPVNLRAHAHGQGYLDVNFLIPEIIATVNYARGPYRADRGDFSTAGTTSFSVYESLPAPFIEITGGSDDFMRGVAAGSWSVGEGHLLGAVEVVRNDGPWDLPADISKTNALIQYATDIGAFRTKFLLTHYDNEWNATDQVPQRLVDAGVIDRFGFTDPTLGGESSRSNLIVNAHSDTTRFSFYASRYELNVFGNFTLFLEDPINGDQHEQVDRRWIYGGAASHTIALSDKAELTFGGDFRYDDIGDTDLWFTTARVRRERVRDDQVEWLSAGAYAELAVRLTDNLRATLGLRGDWYDYEVDALEPLNSGSDSETNFLPSVSVSYTINENMELYANWGEGFHSNDVRGTTISVDPVSGDPLDRVSLFVGQEGAEIGARFEGWQRLNATLTYFWLESDSELLFVGDSGATEPSDGSERTGVELAAFWRITDRWSVDVNASFVDSEFVGVPSGFDHIPNAPGRVIGAGVTYAEPQGWVASLRMRHFGDTPLVEDDSVSRGDTTVYNLGLSRDFGQFTVSADVLNVFDAEDDDIAYFFESQLQTEAAPAEDVLFHPVLPRSVRVSLRWEFD